VYIRAMSRQGHCRLVRLFTDPDARDHSEKHANFRGSVTLILMSCGCHVGCHVGSISKPVLVEGDLFVVVVPEEEEQGRPVSVTSENKRRRKLNLTLFFFLELMSSTSSQSISHKPSNCDEFFMQQSTLFADSLKDLKNLRTQLYSAAEYFELSYTHDDQKQLVLDTLKDYAIKAFINTVDHLGSVTYKVNDILDESVHKVSRIELQVSCMEQRIRTYKKLIDDQGHSQQSLVLMSPKYIGDTLRRSGGKASRHQWCSLDDEDEWHQFKIAVRSSMRDTPSAVRKGRSPSPCPRPFQRTAFSFTEKQSEKRAASPLRAMFPLIRTGSLPSRPPTPVSSRPTTPVSCRPKTPSSVHTTDTRQRYPLEPRKSASLRLHVEKDSSKETEQYPTKSKRLLKALLSRRKSRKDESLYTFLDEY
ncbi:hypothetical protein IFM89_029674, partial [Coptis chinensis]